MAASSGSSLFSEQKLDCKDLHEFLQTLSTSVLDKLYTHPATCLAVFRELPELAKQFVMRTLFVEQPIPQAVVSSWVNGKFHGEHNSAVKTLAGLRIWNEVHMPGGLRAWLLKNTFRVQLRIALLGGGKAWQGAVTGGTPDKYSKDVTFLDNYAKERWECVLHFMVGSTSGAADTVSSDTKQVLVKSGLMRSEAGEMSITRAGFQFVLLDTPTQVWYFMLQYLNFAQARGQDLVECLQFLFQLSFLTLGHDYTTDTMSDRLLAFLQNLRELGLAYQRKRKAKKFYPTRLAINLSSTATAAADAQGGDDYIVVETNYRVYAYTDSDLKVDLLGLFCELLYRFPNLSVGIITRDSVRDAMHNGITASQIINYLRAHLHTEMHRHTPALPPTVVDQIRLWELERDRFLFTEGVLYSQFLSESDFALLRDYARDMGVLVWDNPAKRVVMVTKGGHDEVKRFWKHQKKS